MRKNKLLLLLALLMTAATGAWGMQIYISYPSWPTGTNVNGDGNLVLEMEASDSFENMKAKIEDKSGLNPTYMKLYFNSVEMANDETLNAKGVTSNSVLTLVYTLYTVSLKDGVKDADKWTISPNPAEEGQTVTLQYNGRLKVKSVKAVKKAAPAYTMAAAATTSDKGKLICTAGHIHVYGEDAACTAGRVAKIIYVGPTGHATYNNGLALALEDMSTDPSTLFTWDKSGANNDGKTAAELCSAWNTSKPVTDAEWLLASKDQWNYMLGTNGAGSYTALRDGFESVGGSNLVEKDYWSSTEINDTQAWMFNFGYDWWYDYSKGTAYPQVRACLAF